MGYRHTATWTVDRYTIHSFGNGAAYQIEGYANSRSIWMQGDDAADFREQYDYADLHSTLETDLRVIVLDEYAELIPCS